MGYRILYTIVEASRIC